MPRAKSPKHLKKRRNDEYALAIERKSYRGNWETTRNHGGEGSNQKPDPDLRLSGRCEIDGFRVHTLRDCRGPGKSQPIRYNYSPRPATTFRDDDEPEYVPLSTPERPVFPWMTPKSASPKKPRKTRSDKGVPRGPRKAKTSLF